MSFVSVIIYIIMSMYSKFKLFTQTSESIYNWNDLCSFFFFVRFIFFMIRLHKTYFFQSSRLKFTPKIAERIFCDLVCKRMTVFPCICCRVRTSCMEPWTEGTPPSLSRSLYISVTIETWCQGQVGDTRKWQSSVKMTMRRSQYR